MTGTETDALIERVRAGNVEAYAGVVRAHQSDVWRTVAYALRDIETTRDLVQQAFVNAYSSLDSFEVGRDFGVWVRTIARNLVRGELRRRAREDRRLEVYRRHIEASRLDDAAAEQREQALHEALGRCRQGLPEAMRVALDMRYERAMSFAEIAISLRRSVGASRQMLQRVRLKLRTCIEGRLAGASA